jgi:hypothetical protein
MDWNKINIAAVQKIQWKGNNIFDSVCYSGSNNRNIFGTGSLVYKKLMDSTTDFTPVDKRVCCRIFNMTNLQSHTCSRVR